MFRKRDFNSLDGIQSISGSFRHLCFRKFLMHFNSLDGIQSISGEGFFHIYCYRSCISIPLMGFRVFLDYIVIINVLKNVYFNSLDGIQSISGLMLRSAFLDFLHFNSLDGIQSISGNCSCSQRSKKYNFNSLDGIQSISGKFRQLYSK